MYKQVTFTCVGDFYDSDKWQEPILNDVFYFDDLIQKLNSQR
jgi:hypothetical protein